MKNKRTIFTGIVIVLILSIAFYISQQVDHSMLLFVGIWIVAIILIRILLTPLVVMIVRSRDAKKEQLEKAKTRADQKAIEDHQNNFDD